MTIQICWKIHDTYIWDKNQIIHYFHLVSQFFLLHHSFVTLVKGTSITQRCNSRLINAQWKILDNSMKRSFYNSTKLCKVFLFYEKSFVLAFWVILYEMMIKVRDYKAKSSWLSKHTYTKYNLATWRNLKEPEGTWRNLKEPEGTSKCTMYKIMK